MNCIKRFLPVLLVTLPLVCIGQNVRGRIIDGKTLDYIPYVNIGVLKGERGTVSNDQGYFHLELSGIDPDAEVRFSFIGYENHDISVSDVIRTCSTHCEIRLTPKILEMQEVVVFPREVVEKVVGNPNPLSFAFAGFKNDSLGYEMGIRVKIRKRPTLLKELRLHGLTTTYDSVFYRLNVYKMDKGTPGRNILKEPIYITLVKHDESEEVGVDPNTYQIKPLEDVVIDLSPYRIMVQDDFVIALEYVKELGEGSLYLRTGMLSGKVFFRKTSQAEWHSTPFGLGMSVLIRYQK